MPDDRGMSRRKAMGLGAAALGSVAAYDILAGPAAALASTGPGATAGIGYFARFGVDEKLIRRPSATPSPAAATTPTCSSSIASPTTSCSRTAR